MIEWMLCTVICGTQMVPCAIISEDFGTNVDFQDLFWIQLRIVEGALKNLPFLKLNFPGYSDAF